MSEPTPATNLQPLVERTVRSLRDTTFIVDPIAGAHFSKIVSVMSSAYKRHGTILERAFLEALSQFDDLVVWNDPTFWVPQSVDHVVRSSIQNPTALFDTNLPYTGTGERWLQVDLFVYDKNTKVLSAYEIKRGNGKHDAGKQRSMLVDTLCIQVLLKRYGESRGFEVGQCRSYVIFYYGQCSLKPPFAIKGQDVDAHFGKSIHATIEEVNAMFKAQLFAILSE